MAILLNEIHRFNAIIIKIPVQFFIKVERNNLKVCMEVQNNLRLPKIFLIIKITTRRITIPDFKTYYRDIVIKTACY